MAHVNGDFVWYELMTPDPEASAHFYAAVVGWHVGPPRFQGGETDYRLIRRDDESRAGGILTLSAAMASEGTHACWLPYFCAPEVDTVLAAMVKDGAHVLMPPGNFDEGRIAMLADPQGAQIYLIDPAPGDEADDAVFSPDLPQHVRWNELSSPDRVASESFYARHFGFVCRDSMDMGELGEYRFLDHGDQRIGAVWQSVDADTAANWTFFFGVGAVELAAQAIAANGGDVLMGPHEVPTGDWIVIARDPQGATFGLVGPLGPRQV